MKRWISGAALLAVTVTLWCGLAFAQAKPECDNAKTPQKLEGQVVAIDLNQGKVTMRGSDGATHEFQASKETLQGYKVGDRIEGEAAISARVQVASSRSPRAEPCICASNLLAFACLAG